MPADQSLFERDGVFSSARRLLERARSGRGAALFVLAEAGLGKTSVLGEIRKAGHQEFRTGAGQGDEMEATLPFGLLAQALAGLGGDKPLIGPVPVPSAAEARAARFYAVLRWLEEQDGKPMLILLDDVHWADPDSLALLSFLCRRLDPLPVALVGSLRPWPSEAQDIVRSLEHDGHASIERLPPLSRGAACALLAARVGVALPDETVDRLWEHCGGNPLLLKEAAGALTRGEQLLRSVEGHDLPVAERHLLLSRFAGVPADTLRWLQAASVMGSRFVPDLVSEVATDVGAEITVDAVWRAGLVREIAGGAAEFVHPLFRQAVYDDLALPLRTALHRRAFEVLTRRGRDAEAAEHALQARPAGDPGAVAVLERVGRQALRFGAPAAAANYLEGAVELSGGAVEATLLLALCDALLASGRLAPALHFLERAVTDTELAEGDRAETLRWYGRALWATGAAARAEAAFAEAVDAAVPTRPETAVAALLDHALLLSLTRGPGAALPRAERARAIGDGLTANVRERTRAARHLIALESGDPAGLDEAAAAARAILDRGEPAALLADLHGGQLGTVNSYAVAATWTERLVEADEVFSVLLRELERAGAAGIMLSQSCAYLLTLIRLARLEDGLALARRAATLVEFVPALAPYPALAESWFLLQADRRADHEEAWTRAAEAAARTGDWRAGLWLSHIQGSRFLGDGRYREASDAYRQVETLTRRGGLREPCAVPWARHGVIAHVGADRPADARRVLAWLDDAAASLPCRWPRAAAAAGRAALAEAEGRHEAARDHHRVALALLDGVDLPLERAELYLAHGAFLRRCGRPAEARAPLAAAMAAAEQLGAAAVGRLAHEQLRLAGGRRRRPDDPHRLTASEERVARLVAEGASNREIARRLSLSEATVKSHLEHIFAKLGVHSRRQLMVQPPAGVGAGTSGGGAVDQSRNR